MRDQFIPGNQVAIVITQDPTGYHATWTHRTGKSGTFTADSIKEASALATADAAKYGITAV